jgi:hypothetical protein
VSTGTGTGTRTRTRDRDKDQDDTRTQNQDHHTGTGVETTTTVRGANTRIREHRDRTARAQDDRDKIRTGDRDNNVRTGTGPPHRDSGDNNDNNDVKGQRGHGDGTTRACKDQDKTTTQGMGWRGQQWCEGPTQGQGLQGTGLQPEWGQVSVPNNTSPQPKILWALPSFTSLFQENLISMNLYSKKVIIDVYAA